MKTGIVGIMAAIVLLSACAQPAGKEMQPISTSYPEGRETRSFGQTRGAATVSASRYALLIGIQDYSGTSLEPLDGSLNDIALMSDLLANRLGVPRGNMLLLSDAQATHTGIQQGFAQLADRVGSGDFVYIYYSGHGSETDDKNGDEPSGKDQTWVSYGARSGKFRGIDDYDVLDDEINEWLIPLYRKTDRVVFVSDSCHSATVARRDKVVRVAPPDPRPHPLADKPFQSAAAPGVRIGAARDFEKAIEIIREDKSYGLFTWFWVEALNRAQPGETWGDVFKRAYTLVTTSDMTDQRPQLEGHSEQAVFGGPTAPLPPRIAVTKVEEGGRTVEIQIGRVQGATEKTVYRLYEPEIPAGRRGAPTLELTQVWNYTSRGSVREGSFQVGDLVVQAGRDDIRRPPTEPRPLPVVVNVSHSRPTPACRQNCFQLPNLPGVTYQRIGTQRLEALPQVNLIQGDLLEFAVSNPSERDYYLYLLDVSPEGGIQAIFPQPYHSLDYVRLAAGTSRDLSQEAALRLNKPGVETIKVIASREPIDVELLIERGPQSSRPEWDTQQVEITVAKP